MRPAIASIRGVVGDGGTAEHDDSAARSVRTLSPVAYVRDLDGVVTPVGLRGVSIGRLTAPAAADLTFDDQKISRLHARLERTHGGWAVIDAGSKNGGYVDGRPFGPGETAALRDGAVLRLGDALLVFRIGEPPGAPDDALDALPGRAPAVAAVRRRIAEVAKTAGHVLILGETGTGKERVARWFGAAGVAFVPQNCAELSRELAGSALFGHARGAFTGATQAKLGLVASADGGVLFLDEIGELSLDVQGELLRFLEDGSYRAVGDPELRRSGARVVAATNVDLDAAVRAGRFRRDLLARLRAHHAPIELPPLRDRPEDVLPWAERFLGELTEAQRPERRWTAGAAECLLLHDWPENLRELRGLVLTVARARPRWPVGAEVLPSALVSRRRELRAEVRPGDAQSAPAEEPTRERIEEVLLRTGGRMRTTAEELGVERRRLYRLCEKLGIDVDRYRER